MLIGYARVSTDEQCLDRQVDALLRYGVEDRNIHTEKMTGTKAHRPALDEMLGKLRTGDVVVVESLSRLGRSAKDLLTLAEGFRAADVSLVSLKESIDTNEPYGKMVFTILAALSEFERDIIVSRTRDGLAAARARGRKGGRPPCDPKKLEQAVRLHTANSHSIREITMITGISQTSLYRELNSRKVGAG
jgi:DNA invertase Pin-like site-specific DNA recombinase